MIEKRLSITARLLVRLYTLLMRCEAMSVLRTRRWLVNHIVGSATKNLNIFPHVFIDGWQGLMLGDDVSINRLCHVSAAGGITIGNFVSIGHTTSILSSEHGYDDPAAPIKYQPARFAPVRIGDNVWIGANVTILAGVSIAPGTVVAAGAVVSKSIDEPDTIVGGVPARRIKSRFD